MVSVYVCLGNIFVCCCCYFKLSLLPRVQLAALFLLYILGAVLMFACVTARELYGGANIASLMDNVCIYLYTGCW